jgi:DNA-binding CsgD family transcriptional regulator
VLTPAEQRVLALLREGITNAEIAVRLGISPDGVKYHVSNMLSKLHMERREQLALWKPSRSPVIRRTWAALALGGLLAGAGAIAVGGIVFYRGGGDGTEGPAVAQAATPTLAPQTPECLTGDLALSVRVEPWLRGHLITVESTNNGPGCKGGMDVHIIPATSGASMIGFFPTDRPPGDQETVQLIWGGQCGRGSGPFDIRATVGLVTTTLSNIPGPRCGEGIDGALFPAAKLDPVGLPLRPTCSTSQLRLERIPEQPGPGLPVSVRLTNKATPCRLRGRLSLEVLDEAGRRVDGIFANPDAVLVYADIGDEFGATAFAWENWCGPPGKFTLRLTVGGLSATSLVEAPACEDAKQGSQLRSTQGAGRLFAIHPD